MLRPGIINCPFFAVGTVAPFFRQEFFHLGCGAYEWDRQNNYFSIIFIYFTDITIFIQEFNNC